MYKVLHENTLSFPLGIYLGVELLCLMKTLGLTFWGTVSKFLERAARLCISTSKTWGIKFLHILSNTCYFQFKKYIYTFIYFWFQLNFNLKSLYILLKLYICSLLGCEMALWFWFTFPWWLMKLNIFSCSYWPF